MTTETHFVVDTTNEDKPVVSHVETRRDGVGVVSVFAGRVLASAPFTGEIKRDVRWLEQMRGFPHPEKDDVHARVAAKIREGTPT